LKRFDVVKTSKYIGIILVIIGAFFGTIKGTYKFHYYLEDRYAQAEIFIEADQKLEDRIAKIDYRLDIRVLEDDLRSYMKRLWQLKKEQGNNCRECVELETEIELIRERLRKVRKK
jgi:hypothetical protein